MEEHGQDITAKFSHDFGNLVQGSGSIKMTLKELETCHTESGTYSVTCSDIVPDTERRIPLSRTLPKMARWDDSCHYDVMHR